MITCNRCGKQVPAGAAICSNCGVPVSSSGRGNMDAQEQPALPTWLRCQCRSIWRAAPVFYACPKYRCRYATSQRIFGQFTDRFGVSPFLGTRKPASSARAGRWFVLPRRSTSTIFRRQFDRAGQPSKLDFGAVIAAAACAELVRQRVRHL